MHALLMKNTWFLNKSPNDVIFLLLVSTLVIHLFWKLHIGSILLNRVISQ